MAYFIIFIFLIITKFESSNHVLFLLLQLSILLRAQIIWLIVFIIKMIDIIESS